MCGGGGGGKRQRQGGEDQTLYTFAFFKKKKKLILVYAVGGVCRCGEGWGVDGGGGVIPLSSLPSLTKIDIHLA